MPEASNSPVPVAYKWKEIADLSADLEPLRDRELEALFAAWIAEKDRFAETDVRDFSTRLAREWAIETGIIEDVYRLDRGVTQTLIERGIDSSYIPHESTNKDPELVARTIQAHGEVLEGLFAFVNGQRELTVGYIKELHAALLRHQSTVVVFNQFGNSFETELAKGEYKAHPNNPQRPDGQMHEYSPPEHVATEMERLVRLHRRHEAAAAPAHIEAAWLHHAFTQIHPFQDGNGRVARALATLVFIKRGFFPLVVTRDDRSRYIDALEAADRGSLTELAELFGQIQKRALTTAISFAADVKSVSTVEEALQVTRDLLVNTGKVPRSEYVQAKETAAHLEQIASNRLLEMANRLNQDIARVDRRYSFVHSKEPTPLNDKLAALATTMRFEPNVRDYFSALSLQLWVEGAITRITISFQTVGSAFRGILAVVAYFDPGNDPLISLNDDVFRLSYTEDAAEAEKRFIGWLEAGLIKGLAEWRRTLV